MATCDLKKQNKVCLTWLKLFSQPRTLAFTKKCSKFHHKAWPDLSTFTERSHLILQPRVCFFQEHFSKPNCQGYLVYLPLHQGWGGGEWWNGGGGSYHPKNNLKDQVFSSK